MNAIKQNNAIVLKLYGLGHVPSMKNSKMLARGRLITKPQTQLWMERAIRSIESQLISLSQTAGAGISTETQQRSWIRSSMPLDDSHQWVPEINLRAVNVPKGQEGALIRVERID